MKEPQTSEDLIPGRKYINKARLARGYIDPTMTFLKIEHKEETGAKYDHLVFLEVLNGLYRIKQAALSHERSSSRALAMERVVAGCRSLLDNYKLPPGVPGKRILTGPLLAIRNALEDIDAQNPIQPQGEIKGNQPVETKPTTSD